MTGYTLNDYMQAILVITSAGMVDPYTPPDGTWNLTGSINVTSDGTFGGDLDVTGDVAMAGDFAQTQAVQDASSPTAFTVTGGAHTACVAGAEVTDVSIDLGRIVTFATGAITTQRAMEILAPTYAFVGASTITTAVTLYLDNCPQAGDNAIITNPYTLEVAAGDVLFGGDFAVAGMSTFGARVTVSANSLVAGINVPIELGSVGTSSLSWNAGQATSNTILWGLGAASKSLILSLVGNQWKDHDHAAQSNPTLFVHSATDPDSANDEWVSLTHDVTDAVIDWGSGDLDFAGGSATAATVTHDEYWTVQIGGVSKKIMLGSS